MRQLTRDEVKGVQMDALESLVQFCEKNSLRISMACGTLIGAVRHKGYIPWDDDIDVYMPREDYKRLEKTLPELYDGKYRLASIYREEKWHLSFAKYYDVRTITKVEGRKTIPYGVFVDIFPVDDVPDDDKKFKKYMRRLGILRFILSASRVPTSTMSLIKRILIVFHHSVLSIFPNKSLVMIRERYNQKYNNKGYGRCYANSYGPLQLHPFPKAYFDDIVNWEFEDRQFPGFRAADHFLALQYGNYMQLPSEDKRAPHSEVAFWRDK